MKRGGELRRTGFRQQSVEEVNRKQKEKQARARVAVKTKPAGRTKKQIDAERKAKALRALREQYLLPTITCSRYGTTKSFTRTGLLQGMLWAVFSAYIRKRDGDAPCISCSNIFDKKQAGHFVPAGGNDITLMFDECNVNGECEGCNAFDQFHLVPMRENLITKYGIDTVLELEARRAKKLAVKWEEAEWVSKIIHYYQLIN